MNKLIGALSERLQSINTEDLLFHCSIPVESHITKKNGRPVFVNPRTGKAFMGKTYALTKAEKHMFIHFRNKANEMKIDKPFDCRIWFMAHFHIEQSRYFTKKNEINKKIPDLSNLYELPQDVLTKAGIISDDTLIDSHDGSRRLPSDSNKLEIFLFRYRDL